MYDLVVKWYSTETKAAAVRRTLIDMQGEYLIEPGDAVVATRNVAGQFKLNQLYQPTKPGIVSGTFWVSLIGLLSLFPFAEEKIRAGSDQLESKLTAIGIDHNFMVEAGGALQSRNAALFLLTHRIATNKVLAVLRGTGGKMLRSSFDASNEQALQTALTELRSVHAASSPPVRS